MWNFTNGKLKLTFDETNDGHYFLVYAMVSLENGSLASGSNRGVTTCRLKRINLKEFFILRKVLFAIFRLIN